MELGRSGRPMMTWLRRVGAAAMVPAPVERSELPGHRQRSPNSAALTVGRSPSLAQRCGRCGRKDQRNLAALTMFLPSRARARRRRFQRALTPTDLHRPAGRRCGCWPTSTVLVSGLVLANSVRGDDGARAVGATMMTSASPARAGGDGAGADRAQRATGSSATDSENLQH